jgi:hypothetical protein
VNIAPDVKVSSQSCSLFIGTTLMVLGTNLFYWLNWWVADAAYVFGWWLGINIWAKFTTL